MYYTLAQVC